MSRNRLGFTLVELLITIGLIALLSAATISIIGPQPQRYSRDTRRKADLQTIAGGLEMYRNDHSGYPVAGSWKTSLTGSSYVRAVPVDPKSAADYTYRAPLQAGDCGAAAGGPACAATYCSTFAICATLENNGTASTFCVCNP